MGTARMDQKGNAMPVPCQSHPKSALTAQALGWLPKRQAKKTPNPRTVLLLRNRGTEVVRESNPYCYWNFRSDPVGTSWKCSFSTDLNWSKCVLLLERVLLPFCLPLLTYFHSLHARLSSGYHVFSEVALRFDISNSYSCLWSFIN